MYWNEHGQKKENQRIIWGQTQDYKSISRDLDVPVSTVHNVIKKFVAHTTVAHLPGGGCKRDLDGIVQRRIVWIVEKSPWSTTTQIQADLQTQGTTASTSTIRHQLNERGLYGRRPRRTPLLWERHKKARLQFDKTPLNMPKPFWENVLWTDETKIELFGKAHNLYVYRKQNEVFKEMNTFLTVKHGGGSVMFWGCLLPLALGSLNMYMASWNQENTKVFWSAMSDPVSESWVSVQGSSSRTYGPQTHFNKHPMVQDKTLDCSKVASGEVSKQQLGKGTLQIWENWSSLHNRSGPNYQYKGSGSSLMVIGRAWLQLFWPKAVLPNIKSRVSIILSMPFLFYFLS